jgi:hypothetical protein
MGLGRRPAPAFRTGEVAAVLNTTETILLIVCCILLNVTFLFVLRRIWDPVQRREHNELIGWQANIVGTMYAVIIGFMMYTVWTNYQAANENAMQEANTLVNVFHFAEGLPADSRSDIQRLSYDYARIMLEDEWPAMDKGTLSPAAFSNMSQMWAAALKVKVQTPSEEQALNLELTELNELNEHRRLRELQSESSLPGILWAILIIGGIVTGASSCLFGTNNFKLHLIQVASLALVISLSLAAIADIDQPFRGMVRVQPTGFRLALETFHDLNAPR